MGFGLGRVVFLEFLCFWRLILLSGCSDPGLVILVFSGNLVFGVCCFGGLTGGLWCLVGVRRIFADCLGLFNCVVCLLRFV